jgi:mRNA-degrading endonuclease RelE of RelBE toxin-antitoxin system
MNSHITDKFRKAFAELPADVQKQARQAYRLFKENPQHPSLRFKSIQPSRPIYSVRIGMDYRAVGIHEKSDIIW